MPNNDMTALTLSGPAQRLDEAIERYLLGRDIHPENAVDFLAGMRKLRRPEGENLWRPLLEKADRLLEALGLTPGYAPFEDKQYDLTGCESFLDKLSGQLQTLAEEKAALEKTLADDAAQASIVKHLASVNETLSDLVSLRYVHCRFGHVPAANRDPLLSQTETMEGVLLLECDREEAEVWLLLLSVREQADRADALLSRAGFERIKPEVLSLPDKTAAELLAEMQVREAATRERLAQLAAEETTFREENREELLSRRAFLCFKNTAFAARSYAGLARERFYIVGWVSSDEADSFRAEFEHEKGFSCVKNSSGEIPDAAPPVKLKKRRFGGIFDLILSMYGLPSAGEGDPRPFLAITYILFFGIMFGDLGQGACLVLIGWLLWKKTGGAIWRLFSVCGCSSMLFGLVYGSVFGYEELFPWGGFHVLEGDNLMTTLLLAVALGALVIVACMALNIANGLRRRDYQAALFGPNGLCGMVFYIAVLALVVSLYTKLFPFPAVCIWLCIVLPLVLIWVGEPLGKMLAGDKSWKQDSLGNVLMLGFFDIFESMLSYLSNTMSFLRVGAFAISHAGMMMVVYLIGDVCKGAAGNLLVLIFGNAFVTVLEAGLSSIQIIRLQFYEMFGRYYSGRGKAFQRLTVDYSK